MNSQHNYRRVDIDTPVANAVTVGIETENGQTRAAVWWDAKTGVESGEQQHLSVPEALAAAEEHANSMALPKSSSSFKVRSCGTPDGVN